MIPIKTADEIEIMAEGGKILAEILKDLSAAIGPGIATKEIDKLARELCLSNGVKPAFLDYGGFPAAVCVSVNDEVVHGVPSDRVLKENDLVSLDMGISHMGFMADAAVTVPVLGGQSYRQWAKANPEANKLLEVTKEALAVGMKYAKPGKKIGELAHAIQKVVEKNNFSVVRELVGHGIGRQLHEEPVVPNYGEDEDGPVLAEGMVIAIEPMVTTGDWRVIKGRDGFSYKTADGSLAAHFEHTVVVTKRDPMILTKL